MNRTFETFVLSCDEDLHRVAGAAPSLEYHLSALIAKIQAQLADVMERNGPYLKLDPSDPDTGVGDEF